MTSTDLQEPLDNVRFSVHQRGHDIDGPWYIDCLYTVFDDMVGHETVYMSPTKENILKLFDALKSRRFGNLDEVYRTITGLGF